MTLTELITQIRNNTNATGDTFWSDNELIHLIYEACVDLSREAFAIEATYTTTTVVGQQEYSFPTNTLAIKRVTHNGQKLQPISFREDDALTINNAATTAQGSPQFYMIWDRTIYLRPIPNTAYTLKIFSFNTPQYLTSSSSLEIPTIFHADTIEFVLMRMALKDQDKNRALFHQNRWDEKVSRAKALMKKLKRTDGFASVQDIESLSETILGNV